MSDDVRTERTMVTARRAARDAVQAWIRKEDPEPFLDAVPEWQREYAKTLARASMERIHSQAKLVAEMPALWRGVPAPLKENVKAYLAARRKS
ncbi:MAG: hypothetical protein AAGI24_04105 [Pseudomonadota bacterium]